MHHKQLTMQAPNERGERPVLPPNRIQKCRRPFDFSPAFVQLPLWQTGKTFIARGQRLGSYNISGAVVQALIG